MRHNLSRMASPVEGPAIPTSRTLDAAAEPSATRRLLARVGGDRLLALCVFLVAMALNLYQLTNRSVAFDEAFSIDLASQHVNVILAAGWGNEAHMTLYYLLLHDWMTLTSSIGIASTETVVRLISVISGAMGAVTLFLLAWRFMGRWVALVATVLYLCNFEQLLFAQFTRSYALQLMLGCLSWYALVYAVAYATRHSADTPLRNRMLWWVLYVVASTIFIYAQIFSVLVVAGQVVAFVLICLLPNSWRALARSRFKAFVVSEVAIGLLSSLILVDGVIHGGNNGWVPDATLGSILPTLGGLIYNVGQGSYRVLGGLFVALIALLSLVALLAPWLGKRLADINRITDRFALLDDGWGPPEIAPQTPDDPAVMPREVAVILAACWFLVPFALAFLGTMPIHNFHLFYGRYLIVTLPGLFLLVGLGVQFVPRLSQSLAGLSLRIVPAFLLLAIAVVSLPNYYQSFQAAGTWDVRGAVQWMEQQYQPVDGIVCLPAYFCSIPVQYYLSRDQQLGYGQARFDNSPGQFHFSPSWLGSANTKAIAAYATTHPRIFVITVAYGNADRSAWLNQHYHLQSTYKTDMVTVRLYNTQPAQSSASP